MAQAPTRSLPKEIVEYFEGQDEYVNQLVEISRQGAQQWCSRLLPDVTHELRTELERFAPACMDLLTRPDEILEDLWQSEEIADQEKMNELLKCIEILRKVCNKNAEFKASKTCQCIVEIFLWMVKSTDGTLKDWQKKLLISLEEFVSSVPEFFNPTCTPSEAAELELWKISKFKDNWSWYHNFTFLNAYAKEETNTKKRIFSAGIATELAEPLSLERADSGEFRVLSLGCGPGSDLLAALERWNESRSKRLISCVCVDRSWWPRSAFFKAKSGLKNLRIGAICFVQESIQNFLSRVTEKFHLITLSFVGIGDLGDDILRTGLRNLLTEDGQVLVTDKYLGKVLRLDQRFSFFPTHVRLSNDEKTAPIIIHLRQNKSPDNRKLIVKVHYVLERFIQLNTVESNMPPKRQLQVFILAAQAYKAVGSDAKKIAEKVQLECNYKYSSGSASQFLCSVKNNEEFRQYYRYLWFRLCDVNDELVFTASRGHPSPDDIDLIEEVADQDLAEFFDSVKNLSADDWESFNGPVLNN